MLIQESPTFCCTAEALLHERDREVARLLDETDRRRRMTERLAEMGRVISCLLDPEAVAQQMISSVAQLLGSVSACAYLLDEESGDLVAVAVHGHQTPMPLGARVPPGMGTVGRAVRERRPVTSRDLRSDPNVQLTPQMRETAERLRTGRSVLSVPLIAGDRVIGALAIGQPTGWVYDDEQIRLAELFTAQAATAMENARLYQQVRRAYEQLSEAQEQLTQAQKMEAVGRLAGGVAHDFNNLLTVITGRTTLLRHQLGDGSPARHVGLIEQAAERAAALTRQLLAFSRKQVLQPTRLDVNDVVTTFTPMLRSLIGEDIELEARLAPTVSPVKADPGQLEQVLMNLVVNARDAMPRGGRVTIETRDVVLDAGYAARHADVAPGAYVLLAVRDTGTGMDAATMAHIFEPFFTTREPGTGTGLGLATVYGIVKQSEGHIAVSSEPGHGASFRIYLPVAAGPVRMRTEEPVAASSSRGSETVLLVEDEPDVRDLLREVLMTAGYEVLAARDVHEALRLAEAHPAPIHLLLSDVIMPQISGPEVAAGVQRRRPGIKVLFMSGYTDGAIAHHGVLEPGVAFVQKPFTPAVVSRRIRELLEETPACR